MKIDNEFTVSAPIDRAWAVLTDLEGIAPCLPGAALTGREGDAFSGKVKIKVGPVTSEYAGHGHVRREGRRGAPCGHRRQGPGLARGGQRVGVITADLRPEGDADAGHRLDRPEDHRQDRAVRQRHDPGGLRKLLGPVRDLPGVQAGGRRPRRRPRPTGPELPRGPTSAGGPSPPPRADCRKACPAPGPTPPEPRRRSTCWPCPGARVAKRLVPLSSAWSSSRSSSIFAR